MESSQLISLVVALAGGGLAAYGARTHIQATESRNWPTVTGTITKCKLHNQNSDNDDDPDAFRVEVEYEYEVGGTMFTCNTVSMGESSPQVSGNAALLVHDRFPLRGKVMVSHDPANPSRAVLEPGNTRAALSLIGVGALMLIFGLIYAFA